MPKKFKSSVQILVGVAFVVQLTGCFFVDRDHRRHDDRMEHQDHGHDHDPSIDVRVHG